VAGDVRARGSCVVTALIVGTVLALAALTYVLWPLITAEEGRPRPSSRTPNPSVPTEIPANVGDAEPADITRDDAVEAEIRRARTQLRVCPVCGPRPEPAARYCSRCGRPLA
jgi:hypothetical protein